MLNRRQYAAIALKAQGRYNYAKAEHIYNKHMSGAYARKLARKEKEIFGKASSDEVLGERMLAFVNREEDLPILDKLLEGSKESRDYKKLLDETNTRSSGLDVAMAIAVEGGKLPSWATSFLRTNWTPEKRRIGKTLPTKTRQITIKNLKEVISRDMRERSEHKTEGKHEVVINKCPNCRNLLVDGKCTKCGLDCR